MCIGLSLVPTGAKVERVDGKVFLTLAARLCEGEIDSLVEARGHDAGKMSKPGLAGRGTGLLLIEAMLFVERSWGLQKWDVLVQEKYCVELELSI